MANINLKQYADEEDMANIAKFLNDNGVDYDINNLIVESIDLDFFGVTYTRVNVNDGTDLIIDNIKTNGLILEHK